jgi:hypothetical protein
MKVELTQKEAQLLRTIAVMSKEDLETIVELINDNKDGWMNDQNDFETSDFESIYEKLDKVVKYPKEPFI